MTKKTTKTHRKETWMEKKWRPAIAIMYLIVCVMDFMVFPVAYSWMIVNYGDIKDIKTIWEPLTLSGGGLFHVAMGAVLGVSAWSRGQEKIIRYKNGYEESINDNVGGGPIEDQETTVVANTKPYKYNRG